MVMALTVRGGKEREMLTMPGASYCRSARVGKRWGWRRSAAGAESYPQQRPEQRGNKGWTPARARPPTRRRGRGQRGAGREHREAEEVHVGKLRTPGPRNDTPVRWWRRGPVPPHYHWHHIRFRRGESTSLLPHAPVMDEPLQHLTALSTRPESAVVSSLHIQL